MVWVRPGKLPANVIVAPNSPSARAQHSTAPAAMPGATSGSVTRRNVGPPAGAERGGGLLVAGVGAAQRALDRDHQERHRDERLGEHHAGGGERQRDPERARRASAPTRPRRPKTSSSATPPTTGGSTSGTVTSARTSRRPGNSTRASSQASGTPSSQAEHAWPGWRSAATAAARSGRPARSAARGRVRPRCPDQQPGQRQHQERQAEPAGSSNASGERPRRERAASRRRWPARVGHGRLEAGVGQHRSGPGRTARRRRTPAPPALFGASFSTTIG